MDSVTQALLGANVFAAVQYPSMGKKSLWIGAALGTLPDLDVLLSPLLSEVGALDFHRSISHSLLFALGVAGLCVAYLHRNGKGQSLTHKKRWFWAAFLAVFTHALLDWCTTYGTKMLAPLDNHLFALNLIHVFEPVFTLLLLVPAVVLLAKGASLAKPRRWAVLGLSLATGYLGWAFVNKQHAHAHFHLAAEAQGLEDTYIRVIPTPWNTLLWHGVAVTDEAFGFATYKLGDDNPEPEFHWVEHDAAALAALPRTEAIERYLHYTQGLALCQTGEDGLVLIYAVKFGPTNYCGAPEFVFPLVVDPRRPELAHIEQSPGFFGPTAHLDELVARLTSGSSCDPQ